MRQALLVGGGPVDLTQLQVEVANEPDLIVAVDRGGLFCSELGILPEILIGDFDSLPEVYLVRLRAAGVKILEYSAQKDQSDLELGLDLVLERGFKSIRILGGLGKRLDHTLGNIGLLSKALAQGAAAFLIAPDHEVRLIGPSQNIVLNHQPGWAVSLVPLTERVTGITTSGLAYPLTGEELLRHSCRGLHNQFDRATATIEVGSGVLLVIYFRED